MQRKGTSQRRIVPPCLQENQHMGACMCVWGGGSWLCCLGGVVREGRVLHGVLLQLRGICGLPVEHSRGLHLLLRA